MTGFHLIKSALLYQVMIISATSQHINSTSSEHCNYSSCSQICKNTTSSYTCSCIEGFKQSQEDSSSCQPNLFHSDLIYATPSRIRLFSLTSDQDELDLHTNLISPMRIAYDARTKHVYWTDDSAGAERIYRSLIQENTTEEIFVETGLIDPHGIAIDWITGNIYFADTNYFSDKSHIAVCGNNTNLCAILIPFLDHPRDVALDPNLGLMFWIMRIGKNRSILRANMDGTSHEILFNESFTYPVALTVDIGNNRIYWIDSFYDKIQTAKIDGSDRKIILNLRKNIPRGLSILGDRMYWCEKSNKTGDERQFYYIKSANKRTGLDVQYHMKERLIFIRDLAVYHIANQPISRSNPCKNAGCSHICVISPNNFRCLCPSGFSISSDNLTCKDEGEEKLVIGFKNIVKLLPFDSIGRNVYEDIILSEIKSISDVVYNPLDDKIILSDFEGKVIYEMDYKTRNLSVLVRENVELVKAMDIDIIGGNLYWIDGVKQTVEVLSLRTKARKIIFKGIAKANDILVVAETGNIYISTGAGDGKDGTVFKIQMDGYNLSVYDHVKRKEPVSLMYDIDEEKVRWTGSRMDALKHGGNHFHSINVTLGEMSYNEVGSQLIRKMRIGTFGAKDNSTFFPKMTVITKNFTYLNKSRHECSWENPGKKKCSHLCLARDRIKGVCACPDGLNLDKDGMGCIQAKEVQRFITTSTVPPPLPVKEETTTEIYTSTNEPTTEQVRIGDTKTDTSTSELTTDCKHKDNGGVSKTTNILETVVIVILIAIIAYLVMYKKKINTPINFRFLPRGTRRLVNEPEEGLVTLNEMDRG